MNSVIGMSGAVAESGVDMIDTAQSGYERLQPSVCITLLDFQLSACHSESDQYWAADRAADSLLPTTCCRISTLSTITSHHTTIITCPLPLQLATPTTATDAFPTQSLTSHTRLPSSASSIIRPPVDDCSPHNRLQSCIACLSPAFSSH